VFGSREASEGGRAVVNWTGVQFEVPVGWYDVPVCFMTGSTAPPIGYLTTQPPHAQSDDSHCGPPIDAASPERQRFLAMIRNARLSTPTDPIGAPR
jgi:hypothetical protein